MIFASRNEKGEPAWKLVLAGRKTITRRTKPQPVGAIRAVQAGRGTKGVGFIRITSCTSHLDWQIEYMSFVCDTEEGLKLLYAEAIREGFIGWQGLLHWLAEHGININDSYRIEFELIGGNESRAKGKPCVGAVR